jgi:hypothetical protein
MKRRALLLAGGVAGGLAGVVSAVAQQAASGAPRAKRTGPPEVKPVTVDSVRYEALHWGKKRGLGQNGGFVVAVEVASGRELWVQRIYEIRYSPDMEPDVQDRFITSIRKRMFSSTLDITDEAGRRYRLDPATRTVTER